MRLVVPAPPASSAPPPSAHPTGQPGWVPLARPPIDAIVAQHVEECAHLRHVRSVLLRAPHVTLTQLARLDERVAAHLDGVAIAGDRGGTLTWQALAPAGKGELFLATVRALEDRDADRLETLIEIAEALPAARSGVISAFGWVSAARMRNGSAPLLESSAPSRREVGLAAFALHGVEPGPALATSLDATHPRLRARALRTAGQLGRGDLLEACNAAVVDPDPRCAFEAARSALLLGSRQEALAMLERWAIDPSVERRIGLASLRLVLKVVPTNRARALLADLANDPARARTLIQGVAMAGDPHFVPWLLGQMAHPLLARLAGEAFGFITGLDASQTGFRVEPPEGLFLGPDDDPDVDDVAMDPDDSLPWPHVARHLEWWDANRARFAPGTRYFLGRPLSAEHCLAVLRTGTQRHRMAAAQHWALRSPATPVFNTSAPAWRQARLLGTASG